MDVVVEDGYGGGIRPSLHAKLNKLEVNRRKRACGGVETYHC